MKLMKYVTESTKNEISQIDNNKFMAHSEDINIRMFKMLSIPK